MPVSVPLRQNIAEATVADPLKFSYLPLARSFYLARFADAIRLLGGPTDNLLEVGCGSGIFLPELAKHCEKLWACDSHSNLHLIWKMLNKEGVRAVVERADAANLPYPDQSMDAIVCMSVLEHIRDLDPPTDEFFRVLKPGGIAIIGVPVANLVTEAILRVSHLTLPNARLDDEHVSTHRQVFSAFSRRFIQEAGLNIPRLVPTWFRLYATARFRKPLAS